MFSLSNFLILLSFMWPTPPHSHRFLGSLLSGLIQIYPTGTRSGAGAIGKYRAGVFLTITRRHRLATGGAGVRTRSKVRDRNSPRLLLGPPDWDTQPKFSVGPRTWPVWPQTVLAHHMTSPGCPEEGSSMIPGQPPQVPEVSSPCCLGSTCDP